MQCSIVDYDYPYSLFVLTKTINNTNANSENVVIDLPNNGLDIKLSKTHILVLSCLSHIERV